MGVLLFSRARSVLAVAYLAATGALPCLATADAVPLAQSEITRSYASGPLRVSQCNPRYFEDAQGRVILLAGDSEMLTVMDTGSSDLPGRFDFPGYLAFLHRHNLWAALPPVSRHQLVQIEQSEPNPEAADFTGTRQQVLMRAFARHLTEQFKL